MSSEIFLQVKTGNLNMNKLHLNRIVNLLDLLGITGNAKRGESIFECHC
jgi:hypothetical protein